MASRDRICGAVPMSIALLTAATLAACSAKNPDALTAANLDENLAAMDSNGTVNAEGNAAVASGNAGSNAVVAGSAAPAGKEAASTTDANVDAAVNGLREIAAQENEYCDTEMQAAGEADDCDDN